MPLIPTFTFDDVRKRSTGERELLRARRLIDRGKLIEAKLDEKNKRLELLISGSSEEPYDVRVTGRKNLGGSLCTCPAFAHGDRNFCKHIAAGAMLWMEIALGEDVAAESIDLELVQAIDSITPAAAKDLLLDAASLSEEFRERMLKREWE